MSKKKKPEDELDDSLPEITLMDERVAVVETTHGSMLYIDWLKKEQDRINAGVGTTIFKGKVMPVFIVEDGPFACLSHEQTYKRPKVVTA